MNTTIEQKLVDYFVQKYPTIIAIVLHGSRANGNARQHSDWDLVFFCKAGEKVKTAREIVFGCNCETPMYETPIATEKLIETLGAKFRSGNTKILFDTNDVALDIVARCEIEIAKPREFLDTDLSAMSCYMRSNIDGMVDYAHDEDGINFMLKLADFTDYAMMTWYRFHQRSWRPQLYSALPYIKSQDQFLYDSLVLLASDISKEQKIAIAEKVHEHIFG